MSISSTDGTYKEPKELRLVSNSGGNFKAIKNSDTTRRDGGGSDGGGDMDKRLSLLELRASYVETNVYEIKNSLNSLDNKVSNVQRDLSNDVKWLIVSGIAALFTVYMAIGSSLDKEISTLTKQISSQLASVSDQIKELKSVGYNSNSTHAVSQEEKK